MYLQAGQDHVLAGGRPVDDVGGARGVVHHRLHRLDRRPHVLHLVHAQVGLGAVAVQDGEARALQQNVHSSNHDNNIVLQHSMSSFSMAVTQGW